MNRLFTTAFPAAVLLATGATASADAPTCEPSLWRGLRVCAEESRDGYNRDDYGRGYRSLENEIIAAMPESMFRENGRVVLTPYSCAAFPVRVDGTAATDIEHVVAFAEAHDSGVDPADRRAFAADLGNLAIAARRNMRVAGRAPVRVRELQMRLLEACVGLANDLDWICPGVGVIIDRTACVGQPTHFAGPSSRPGRGWIEWSCAY